MAGAINKDEETKALIMWLSDKSLKIISVTSIQAKKRYKIGIEITLGKNKAQVLGIGTKQEMIELMGKYSVSTEQSNDNIQNEEVLEPLPPLKKRRSYTRKNSTKINKDNNKLNLTKRIGDDPGFINVSCQEKKQKKNEKQRIDKLVRSESGILADISDNTVVTLPCTSSTTTTSHSYNPLLNFTSLISETPNSNLAETFCNESSISYSNIQDQKRNFDASSSPINIHQDAEVPLDLTKMSAIEQINVNANNSMNIDIDENNVEVGNNVQSDYTDVEVSDQNENEEYDEIEGIVDDLEPISHDVETFVEKLLMAIKNRRRHPKKGARASSSKSYSDHEEPKVKKLPAEYLKPGDHEKPKVKELPAEYLKPGDGMIEIFENGRFYLPITTYGSIKNDYPPEKNWRAFVINLLMEVYGDDLQHHTVYGRNGKHRINKFLMQSISGIINKGRTDSHSIIDMRQISSWINETVGNKRRYRTNTRKDASTNVDKNK